MSAAAHSNRFSPDPGQGDGQQTKQPVQSAQLSQVNGRKQFAPGSENAQNGRKLGPVLAPQEDGPPADESPQTPPEPKLSPQDEEEEAAIAKAQLWQLSDMLAQRDAHKSAAKKGGQGGRQMPFPQVVIHSTGRILARRSVGRPTVVTDSVREQIVLLLGGGASLTQAAAHIGIARSTVARALAHDEEFAREVHEARQRAMLFPLNCLLREASRNWRAAAWLLSYLDRKCEQERSRRERIMDAAGQEIEQDLIQELRERARQHREETKTEVAERLREVEDGQELFGGLPTSIRRPPRTKPDG